MKVRLLALSLLLTSLLSLPALAANQTANKSMTLTVVSQVAISTTSLPAAVVGVPYTAQLTAAGGTSPYTWAVSTATGQTGLPAGLTLAGTTGVLSGTIPTTACTTSQCTFSFTITVTDSSGSLGKLEVKTTIQNAKVEMKLSPPKSTVNQQWLLLPPAWAMDIDE